MRRIALLAAFLAVTARPGSGAAQDLRVFSSGGVAVAQQSMAARNSDGPRIAFTVAMPAVLQAKLSAGEPADVIVAPVQLLDVLERANMLAVGSRITVARVGVGVAVRDGAARPDVSSVAALRVALLAAPSIVHPDPAQQGSVAGKAIDRMLTEMGLAAELKPRTVYRQAIAGGVEMVAKGEAAFGLFNISEILSIKGVALAGPLPEEVQSYVVFAAAALTGSPAEKAARTYLRTLLSTEASPHWEAAGLEVVARFAPPH